MIFIFGHQILAIRKFLQATMEDDIRLNSQLKSLGKKLFQFRDLVAKIDIPETLPPPPYDRIFWEVFVKKCSSAVTVLRQVQAALTPDMYHLSVHPGDKIWRNPAAVPDLLGMPDSISSDGRQPIVGSPEEVSAWNNTLEEATRALEEYLSSAAPATTRSNPQSSSLPSVDKSELISSLFASRSSERSLVPPS